MTAETTADRGLIIDDYDASTRGAFDNYVKEELAAVSYLPPQVDEWGCVSATGAFIMNRLMERDIATASDVDEALGREPNKPGDIPKLGEWLLGHNFKSESYIPYSPLAEPAN